MLWIFKISSNRSVFPIDFAHSNSIILKRSEVKCSGLRINVSHSGVRHVDSQHNQRVQVQSMFVNGILRLVCFVPIMNLLFKIQRPFNLIIISSERRPLLDIDSLKVLHNNKNFLKCTTWDVLRPNTCQNAYTICIFL